MSSLSLVFSISTKVNKRGCKFIYPENRFPFIVCLNQVSRLPNALHSALVANSIRYKPLQLVPHLSLQNQNDKCSRFVPIWVPQAFDLNPDDV
jgi:hypothetical protein